MQRGRLGPELMLLIAISSQIFNMWHYIKGRRKERVLRRGMRMLSALCLPSKCLLWDNDSAYPEGHLAFCCTWVKEADAVLCRETGTTRWPLGLVGLKATVLRVSWIRDRWGQRLGGPVSSSLQTKWIRFVPMPPCLKTLHKRRAFIKQVIMCIIVNPS